MNIIKLQCYKLVICSLDPLFINYLHKERNTALVFYFNNPTSSKAYLQISLSFTKAPQCHLIVMSPSNKQTNMRLDFRLQK